MIKSSPEGINWVATLYACRGQAIDTWVQSLIVSAVYWLIGWLVDWLIEIDGLIDWLVHWLVGWLKLIDGLIDCLVDWLVGWWIGCLVDRPVGWLLGWLIRVFAIYRLLGNINIIVNPTNSPAKANSTQEKSGYKWHLGHFFPKQIIFFGWDWFYMGNRLQETTPNQILRNTYWSKMSIDRVWTPWQTAVKELFTLKLVSCV